MNLRTLFISVVLIASVASLLQAEDKPAVYGIQFSGFVKSDFFYDSRQTVSIREGHFLLFPSEKLLDEAKNDINAAPNVNFLSIQTRLTGKITAPDAFGAKASGLLEADFFGNENAAFVDANGFRLRHAIAKLSWQRSELLLGQFWHPMFVTGCYSEVISFNTGVPFQPFSRNPQIRYTYKPGQFAFMAALAGQRDFSSAGGSAVLRNAVLPDLHLQLQYESRNDETRQEILAGIGGGYKMLRPLLFTEKAGKKYAADENVSGYSATAFVKVRNKSMTTKLQAVYGQNLFDLLMLGGYAVASISDTAKNSVTYTPLAASSCWIELMTNGPKVQLGMWAGYSRNMGASDPIAVYSNKVNGTDATARGANIKNLMRLSPRVVFISGKFNIALETEYTTAAYATKDGTGKLNRNAKGVITEAEQVSNLRVLLAAILKF